MLARNIANSEAGRTSLRLSPQSITENSDGDGDLGDGLAKDEFCTDMFGLLILKITLSLC